MNAIVKLCKKHGQITLDNARARIRKLANGSPITRYECLHCAREAKRRWAILNPEKIQHQRLRRYIIRDNIDGTLQCCTCKGVKPLREFFKSQHNYKSPRCKICIRKSTSSYYQRNKEKYREINRVYVNNNREAVRARNHKSKLKNMYGMTLEEYERLLITQNNCCAICKNPESAIDKRYNYNKLLSVDHCHSSGKIRGLLCDACNRGIGMFCDSIKILRCAINYLQKNN